MFFNSQPRRGLFGSPGQGILPGDQPGQPGYPGGGGPLPGGNPGQTMPKKRGGIFGTGIGLGDIIGVAGDAVAINRGMAPPHATAMHEFDLLRRQQELEDSKYQRKRADDWSMWQRQQDYERANPKPANNDTLNDMAAAATWTPQQWAIYDQLHPVYKTGPDGLTYPVARSSLGTAAPTKPVGRLTPMGGAAPAGTPPFAEPPRAGFVPPTSLAHGKMTSGRRTVEGNRAVGGVVNSPHLGPNAADYWGPDLNATLGDVRKLPGLKRAFIHDAGSGKHVHAEGEGWNTPYFGKRGAKGKR